MYSSLASFGSGGVSPHTQQADELEQFSRPRSVIYSPLGNGRTESLVGASTTEPASAYETLQRKVEAPAQHPPWLQLSGDAKPKTKPTLKPKPKPTLKPKPELKVKRRALDQHPPSGSGALAGEIPSAGPSAPSVLSSASPVAAKRQALSREAQLAKENELLKVRVSLARQDMLAHENDALMAQLIALERAKSSAFPGTAPSDRIVRTAPSNGPRLPADRVRARAQSPEDEIYESFE
jgi:hypothetical protein